MKSIYRAIVLLTLMPCIVNSDEIKGRMSMSVILMMGSCAYIQEAAVIRKLAEIIKKYTFTVLPNFIPKMKEHFEHQNVQDLTFPATIKLELSESSREGLANQQGNIVFGSGVFSYGDEGASALAGPHTLTPASSSSLSGEQTLLEEATALEVNTVNFQIQIPFTAGLRDDQKFHVNVQAGEDKIVAQLNNQLPKQDE